MAKRNNKDHLSNKVSINAKLTEAGISVETKSRTFAAIDRLGGGLLDVPIAYLENWAGQISAKGQVAIQSQIRKLDSISVDLDSEVEAKLNEHYHREADHPAIYQQVPCHGENH